MDRSIRVYGGFRLTNNLAEKVQEAVSELLEETFGRDLSHEDHRCRICVSTESALPDVRVPVGLSSDK